jgi:hypothetical protein
MSPTSTASSTGTATSSPTFTHTPAPMAPHLVVIYPNPVNCGSVRIHLGFDVSVGRIEITMFTTAFRIVKHVKVLQVFNSSSDFQMDLMDDWGSQLSNGVYYIVVTSPTFKVTTKLLILR